MVKEEGTVFFLNMELGGCVLHALHSLVVKQNWKTQLVNRVKGSRGRALLRPTGSHGCTAVLCIRFGPRPICLQSHALPFVLHGSMCRGAGPCCCLPQTALSAVFQCSGRWKTQMGCRGAGVGRSKNIPSSSLCSG